jgi:Leucine-rich repeat (LRR) protein
VLMLVLQELPTELGKLPSLAQLDLRKNQLAVLPPALGDAGSLCELRVGFNKLSSLPTTLGMLRNLKTLDVRNNLVEVCLAARSCLVPMQHHSLCRLNPAVHAGRDIAQPPCMLALAAKACVQQAATVQRMCACC